MKSDHQKRLTRRASSQITKPSGSERCSVESSSREGPGNGVYLESRARGYRGAGEVLQPRSGGIQA